ncbi:MAG TPA: Do family serine endopeptidase [Alphaproteobacteria bacterium]|nr:Do family serine endopeptidase [Alphaproteobacteria bacterium]
MSIRSCLRKTALAWLAALTLTNIASADNATMVPYSFANLVEPLVPAVVNISTTTLIRGQGEPGQSPLDIPFSKESPLEDFFKEFLDRMKPEGPRNATSLGSGFIIDPDGFIVTNYHVVSDADQITVILNDNTELKATVVGRDRRTDVAVLKIKADKKLPFVQWGDSTKLRTGDWIVAIGNPFGLGGTVTAGIVSHLARDIGERSRSGDFIDGYIQTDASINLGNSGGPMFDMSGKVVGMNTAIFTPTGASVGIGFAIPSEIVQKVVNQIRQYGRTKRGWIGVRLQPVTEDIAEGLGLKDLNGALVGSVVKDGPAAKAKLQTGDVILKVGNVEIKDERRVARVVGDIAVGTNVPVTVWRKGKILVVPVQVGEYEKAEEEGVIPSPESGKELAKGVAIHGMTLQLLNDVSEETRHQYGIPKDAQGVFVAKVEPESSAGEKGIRTGDIIMEISQQEVKTPQNVVDILKKAEKDNRKSVLLLISRDNELRFVSIKIGPEATKQ